MLAVNRQVRVETVPIFYGENKFSFHKLGTIVPFLKCCTLFARQEIRHLGISFEVTNPLSNNHYDHQVHERARAFAYIARRLSLKTIDLLVFDDTFRFEHPLISLIHRELWVQDVTRIQNLDKLRFDVEFEGIEGHLESYGDWFAPPPDPGEMEDKADEVSGWLIDTRDGYLDYLNSRMLKKKQTQLGPWLERHVCGVHCEGIGKGRAASKVGLPQSGTHGLWTLPDVDLEALFEVAPDPIDDDSDVDEWSDEHSEATEDDDEIELCASCSTRSQERDITGQQS
ncbi:MAG: hypothetical protein Q9168_000147 [Polycauliona sp. 1 TL-2023]